MIITTIKRLFNKYPLLSNSVVYCGMCVGAEYSQQIIKIKCIDIKCPSEPIDTKILERYALVGGVNSVILYYWYKWLDKKYVGTSLQIIAKKLILDEMIMTPFLIVIFYIGMSAMERKKNLTEECQHKFMPTFLSSCVLWIPAQTLNFLFIPPAARVVYVGTIEFIWINVLCILKRSEIAKKEENCR